MVKYLVSGLLAVALPLLILSGSAYAQDATSADGPRIEALRVEPQQAEAGGQQNIVVELFNPGEATSPVSGSSVSLSLEIDGQVFETRSVHVAAGSREVTTFAVPALAPGAHGVKIGDAEARFVVTGGGVEAPEATGCTLRAGMQVRLQNIVDTINVDQDGHIELSFRNPPVNDCVVEADLRITVPQNIIPIAKEGGISGSAGTLNAFVETPSGTERALIMDFKGQKKGNYFIAFSGTYWPKGNKDLFQPITLQQQLIVAEPSIDLPVSDKADETEDKADETEGKLAEDKAGTDDSDDPLLPMWLIAVIVLVVLVVVVALVAIVGISRRGGGTTVIRE